MKVQRRNFLKSSLLLAGGLYLPAYSFGTTKRKTNAPARIRKEIHSLKADDPDLVSYKKAVEVMKSRPASDPKSWAFQASIHKNFCPHSNWFFLPWHRAYLLKFEEICREASDNPGFNLPYWDWTLFPKFPPTFSGSNNILNDPSRLVQPDDIALSELVGQRKINDILGRDSFEDFASVKARLQRQRAGSGALESGPHNHIHNFVRGNMGSPPTAALDPIFWLHHANIDRIWATWNDAGHANSEDPIYTDLVFSRNFYGTDGVAIDVKSGEMSDQDGLGYAYDTQQGKTKFENNIPSTFALLASDKLVSNQQLKISSNAPASFGMTGFKKLFNAAFAKLESSWPKGKREVKAIISQITPVKEEDFFVRVFIDAPSVDQSTSITSKHYVGSFAFFASEHGDHGENHEMQMAPPPKLSFIFDITNNLKQLYPVSNKKTLKDKIKLQLLAVPYDKNKKAEIIAGKVEIVIAENKI